MSISIIIPSRGPVDELARTLWSAQATAHCPLEVVVRCDLDDPALPERVATARTFGATVCVGPRWRGYDDTRAFAHQAAVLTTGEWILHLDDDAEFMRAGWSEALSVPGGVRAAHLGPSIPFWAVSRGWYNQLGGLLYGGDPVDAWLVEATNAAPTLKLDLTAAGFLAHHYKPREAARIAGRDPVVDRIVAPERWIGPKIGAREAAVILGGL